MNRNRLYLLVMAFALVGYSLVFFQLFYTNPAQEIRSLCFFKAVSGQPCPACGTTRSVSFLAQGNLTAALLTNPLGFIAALLLIVAPVMVIFDYFQKKDRFLKLYVKAETLLKKPTITVLAIAMVLANWIWNIVKQL
ncbi:MAG: DUF2752 domain-containing protein [Bacteroidota bacterium]|nr:MAG: DUF2752 domain-containing protein [Bacteroidota bacterium]